MINQSPDTDPEAEKADLFDVVILRKVKQGKILDFLRYYEYNNFMRQIQITLPQKKIYDFCLKWKISEMALFGSVLSENFRPDSDIDVLVSFKDDAGWGLFDFVDMIDELKVIFGRKVDFVEKDSLRNPFRKQAILAHNEVIYAA